MTVSHILIAVVSTVDPGGYSDGINLIGLLQRGRIRVTEPTVRAASLIRLTRANN